MIYILKRSNRKYLQKFFIGRTIFIKVSTSKSMQKTIFITGASAGLGKATAQLFHLKGWNVIAQYAI